MSVLTRARARLLACCVAGLAVLGALVFAPAAGAANLVTGNTYLAVGDSLTYGYHAKQFAEEIAKKGFAEATNYEEGFVNDFGNTLKVLQPKLSITNLGCPGETTETSLNGPGAPYTGTYCAGGPTGSPFPFAFLHKPYTHNTQLEEAEAILKANPNVSPITVDLGANDILQFLEATCGYPTTYTCTEAQVATELFESRRNVGTIIEKLHAVAPKAQIVTVGLYNPYPLALPPPGGDASSICVQHASWQTKPQIGAGGGLRQPSAAVQPVQPSASARNRKTSRRSVRTRQCVRVASTTRRALKLTFIPPRSATR